MLTRSETTTGGQENVISSKQRKILLCSVIACEDLALPPNSTRTLSRPNKFSESFQ